MFSSDNATYSWYYTATYWKPAWAEQVHMVFPEQGVVVMNFCRQYYTHPAYTVGCTNPDCPAYNRTHFFRFGRARTWFLHEDWSKRRQCYDYDNTVLTVTFTNHERELSMIARPLFLF
jgi:hypothetical protein